MELVKTEKVYQRHPTESAEKSRENAKIVWVILPHDAGAANKGQTRATSFARHSKALKERPD